MSAIALVDRAALVVVWHACRAPEPLAVLDRAPLGVPGRFGALLATMRGLRSVADLWAADLSGLGDYFERWPGAVPLPWGRAELDGLAGDESPGDLARALRVLHAERRGAP